MSDTIDIVFIFMVACFVVEQIFYWFLGSYPYRYGFKVRTIFLSRNDNSYCDLINSKKILNIKTKADKTEVYLKYRYNNLVIGPSLFVGQIKNDDSTSVLHIRVGQISAIFVLFMLIYPVVSSDIFTDPMSVLMDITLLVIIVVYFYSRFMNKVNEIISGKRVVQK